MTAEELLTTGELMRLSGFSRQRLYSYSTLGLIEPVERTPGGHGRFSPRVLRDLQLIVDLNASGYPLREIKEIFFARVTDSRR